MKINKYNRLLSIVLTVFLFSVISVSALNVTESNITVHLPLTGIGYTQNITMSVFMDYSGGGQETNFTQGNFYWRSTSVNDSAWRLMEGKYLNETDNGWNVTINTSSGFEDSADYQFLFQVFNGTTRINKTISNIRIDNTIPIAATVLLPTDNSENNSQTVNFSATMTDEKATGCSLHFDGMNPGSSSQTASYTETSCSFQLTGIAEGTYNWFIRSNDGTNTTDSVISTVRVDLPTSTTRGGVRVTEAARTFALAQQVRDNVPPAVWWVLGIILVVGGIVWFVTRK